MRVLGAVKTLAHQWHPLQISSVLHLVWHGPAILTGSAGSTRACWKARQSVGAALYTIYGALRLAGYTEPADGLRVQAHRKERNPTAPCDLTL